MEQTKQAKRKAKFKRTLKKSLSVMLTLMMVFTCWVFTPPTEAEALTQGTYYYKVYVYVYDEAWVEDNLKLYFYSSSGSTVYSFTIDDSKLDGEEGESYAYTFSSTTFVSSFKVGTRCNVVGGYFAARIRLYVDEVAFTNGSTCSSTGVPTTVQGTSVGYIAYTDSYSWSDSVSYSWAYPSVPVPTTVTATASTTSVTIPTTGSSSTTFTHTFTVLDQYGVVIPATYSITSTQSGSGGTATYSTSNGSSSLVRTFTLTSSQQDATTTYSNTIKSYCTFTYNSTSKTTSTLTTYIYDPYYTVSYDANSNASANLTDPTISTTSASIRYGSYATVPTVSMDNATFLGFYSADTDPIYEDSSALNSLTKLTSTTQVFAAQSWYAAWQVDDYVATFKSYDGQTLASDVPVYWGVTAEETTTSAAAIKNLESTYNLEREDTVALDYTFDGWVVDKAWDSDGNEIDLNGEIYYIGDYDIVGNVEYVAHYTVETNQYDTTFVDKDGATLQSSTDDYGTTLTAPTVEDYQSNTQNFDFIGWVDSSKADGANALYVDSADDVTLSTLKVTGDSTLVPVYVVSTRYYDINFTYSTVDGITTTDAVQYEYGEEIIFPTDFDTSYSIEDTKYSVTSWTDEAGETAGTTVTASQTYTAVYEQTEATYTVVFMDNDGVLTETVYHWQDEVTVPEVASYIEDDYKYNFSSWDKTVSETATADIIYTAQYTVHELFDVTFYYLSGDEVTIEVADGEMYDSETIADDAKLADDTYTYEFDKWATKDGEVVTTITGDTDLYPEFDATYIDYTVTFLDDDGTQIQSATYHYGDTVIIEDPTKEATHKYTYTFSGWSPSFEGKCDGDQVYTAEYKATENLYELTWYNDDETTILHTSSAPDDYSISSFAPTTIPTTTQPDETGYVYNFTGWVDEDGNSITGKLTAGTASYYATYEKVKENYVITFMDSDAETVFTTYGIEYEVTLEDFSYVPATRSLGDETHEEFSHWSLTVDGEAFDMSTILSESTTLYAVYTTEAHYTYNEEINVYPTFISDGNSTITCECGYTHTRYIDALVDTYAATGNISVSNTGTSTDLVTEVTNGSIVSFSAKDSAETGEFNVDGTGSGITYAGYALVLAGEDMQTATYYSVGVPSAISSLNKSIYLGNLFQSLPTDVEFTIVLKTEDDEGNISYIESETMIIDTIACEITITSGDQYEVGQTVFCDDATATVTNLDDIASITVNGEEVNITANASYDGELYFTTAGTYTIKTTDDAGNTDEVTIKINGGHISTHVIVDATCDADGSDTEICSVCGEVLSEVVVLEQLTHNYVVTETFDGTCIKESYVTSVCEYCDDEQTVYGEVNADVHNYVKGETVDPTCEYSGYTSYTCEECSKTITDDITAATGHSWGTSYAKVEATTENSGELWHDCTVEGCGASEFVETIPMLETYTVVIYDADGKVAYTSTVTEGEEAYLYESDITVDTDKEDDLAASYTFLYWADANGYAVSFPVALSADLTLTPVYQETAFLYTVTFYDDNTNVLSETVCEYGTVLSGSQIPTPTKETDDNYEYTFSSWTPAVSTTVVGDAIYTAVYSTKAITEAYVTIYNEDGTVAQYFELEKGNVLEEEDLVVEESSYEFLYWAYENGTKVEFPVLLSTTTMTISPVYSDVAITYEIVFYDDDGSILNGFDVMYGTATADLGITTPTKASNTYFSYEFAGWSPALTDEVTEDATYTATYTVTTKTYTITFMMDDLSAVISSTKVTAGSDAIEPETPTKASDDLYDYTFSGWDMDSSAWTDVTSDAVIKATFTRSDRDYTTDTTDPEVTDPEDGDDDDTTVTVCSCSCHKDGFSGWIYRLFQKFAALFTGSISCCDCPDSRY